MLVLDAEEVILFHRLPCWPGAEDLEESDEEGMPLLWCAEQLFSCTGSISGLENLKVASSSPTSDVLIDV